jgi:hypothetical protein
MPSTTRTLADRLAKLTRVLPENDPATAMHRNQRLALHFLLAVQAVEWEVGADETDQALDRPAMPGYLSPTRREVREFVQTELDAIARPEPIPSERVFVASFLWVHFLELRNSPPPDPPRDGPVTWQFLSTNPLRGFSTPTPRVELGGG